MFMTSEWFAATTDMADVSATGDHQKQQSNDDCCLVVCRPNNELSMDEKVAKKQLKKKLRQQTRLRKLTVRLSQALDRHDEELYEETQQTLDEFFAEHPEMKDVNAGGDVGNYCSHKNVNRYAGHDVAKALVHSINCRLNDALRSTEALPLGALVDGDCSQSAALQRNEFYAQQVRPLMQSMMKGTQTENLFDNQHALVAYTRRKFYERSMLVIDSLGKLMTRNSDECSHFVARLLQVTCICSIGCGPGCDALGAVAFVKTLAAAPTASGPAVTADPVVILLDWTIDQWRENILSTLETLLVPEHIKELATGKCDVRVGLMDAANIDALHLLQARAIPTLDTSAESATIMLYLVSYLLSEARDKWQLFFDDLIRGSGPGTLFLISDPTSWQLYIWMERYRDRFEFVWLDSSMDRPDLQTLMRRFGPAVVLAMKR